MTWPWDSDTVVRLRPTQAEDSHGNLRPQWSNPDQLVCEGVSFAPAEDGDGGTIYAPENPDIAKGDHVTWRGVRFEVMGIPQDWHPGLVVVVKGVDTPGQ